MEGPSLVLAAEQLIAFKGKTIRVVSGNTKIGKERLLGRQIQDVFSWGKHLILQCDTFGIRTHFLLFGTYEADIDGVTVTGDYKRAREPRLALTFDNGELRMFNCSIKYIEDAAIKSTYDFTIDIMSDAWNPKKALRQLASYADEEVADVLLDQTVFSGVGNIIKNEVLSLAKVNPKALCRNLSVMKKRELVNLVRSFSLQFLVWRREFVLRKHLRIHRKKYCPHCAGQVTREKTGKRQRWSYYCPSCQPLPIP